MAINNLNPYGMQSQNMNQPYMQPYQMPRGPVSTEPQLSTPHTNYSFGFIAGDVAAEGYPVGINNTVFLFDESNMKMYIKSTDINGRPSQMRRYRMVEDDIEENVQQSIDTSMFVTKDEIENLIEKKTNEILNRNRNNKKKGAERK